MKATLTILRGAVSALAVALAASTTDAQQLFYDWIGPSGSNWDVDASWNGNGLNFVPDANVAAGESARVNNGGTVVVNSAVPRVAALNVASGTLRIENNGVVETIVDSFGNGALSVGAAGTVSLLGNGQLTVAGPGTNAGTIRLNGPAAGIDVAGSFSTSGTIGAGINSATNHGLIDVAGAVSLGGTLNIAVSGFAPAFGQSWNIIQGTTLSGGFNDLVVESSPPLARGLSYQLAQSGNTASVRVGNSLILSVNRQTGATSVSNVVGGPIDITSYAILSENDLLAPANWTSLADTNTAGAGWTEANPASSHLAELNLQNAFAVPVGQSLVLGNVYGGATATPPEEDLVFQYTTSDGRLHQGVVEYGGVPNDLVLFVDPATGAAAVGNLSPHIAAPDVTGYAIRSAGGQLTNATWDSFADSGGAGSGWTEANPSSSLLAELNLQNSMAFTNGTLVPLGEIFLPNGSPDLTFEYTTLAGDLLAGTIQYGAIPAPPAAVPGDYNGNGMVDAADYVLWRNTLTQPVSPGTGADGNSNGMVDEDDYQFWRARFGNTAGVGSRVATAAAVPEPTSLLLVFMGLVSCSVRSWQLRLRGIADQTRGR